MGNAFGGQDTGKAQREEAQRQQAAQERKMRAEQMLADANAANAVTKVEVGGTDTPDTLLEDARRRKGSGTVSSQVGVI
jgi:hypothetical protein